MIEETATVARIEGQWAWLQTDRNSSCSKCSAHSGCGISLLDKFGKPRQQLVKALNRANASDGDQVIVGLDEQALVRGSAVVYLSPLLGLFGGAALGEALAPWNGLLATEPTSILLGLAGLAAGLHYLWRYSRRNLANPRYQPIVLRTQPKQTMPVELLRQPKAAAES